MTEDGGNLLDLLARVLVALFRNRPSCALGLLVSIIAIVLGGMLFQAKSPDDRVFPIIGLSFISVMAFGHAIRALRRRSVKEVQQVVDTPIAHEPQLLPSEDRPPEAVPLEPVPMKPSVDLRPPLLAAVLAAAVVPPLLCVSAIFIPMRAPVSYDAVEALVYVATFIVCAASPLAACIAAMATVAFTRLAGRRNLGSSPSRTALLAGGATGLLAGVIGALIMANLSCGSERLCSP